MSTEHPESSGCMIYGSSQNNPKAQHKLSSINTGDDDNDYPRFEMKEKFDLVIEELSIYFEISHDSGKAAATELCVGKELSPSEEYVSSSRFSDRPRSPAAEPPRDTSMGDDEGTRKTSRAEPEKTRAAESLDCEQEVPVDCSLHSEGEELMYSSVKQKGGEEILGRLGLALLLPSHGYSVF